MAPRGCTNCRSRHTKCIILSSGKCRYCTKTGSPCVLLDAVRFRPVTAVKTNGIGDTKVSLKFALDQEWVKIPDSYVNVEPKVFFVRPQTKSTLSKPNVRLPWEGEEVDLSPITPSLVAEGGKATEQNYESRNDASDAETAITSQLHIVPDALPACDVDEFNELEWNIVPSILSNAQQWPLGNEVEARILHHFIVHCTPWVDICDSDRHFEMVVPERAMHCRAMLCAVLGLAAQHMWLVGKMKEDISRQYIDDALEELIVALEDPLAQWNEDFLVTVILLRLHEEMSETDDQCHHLGSARVLNSICSFAADGGLREAASWISLRQHLTVSLVKQQPLDLDLSNYGFSKAFGPVPIDNESWTNRIIYIFARILQQSLTEIGDHGLTEEQWTQLKDEVDDWEKTRPKSFRSILKHDIDIGAEFTGSWPYLPTARGVIAVGLQFWHLCEILLILYSPYARPGLSGARQRIKDDAAVRRHIRIVLGYGKSNAHCPNTLFQGGHILAVCGAYIIDKSEQDACVEYLRYFQRVIGWRTAKSISELQYLWAL